MQRSVIGRYSLGIVAENKKLDENIIQVIPVESLNLMTGELCSETVTLKSSGLKEDGTTYKVEVEMGATLEAEWFGETNRLTSPDVRRGEQVWIWQSENADKYYWTAIGRDDNQRRLETVTYTYNGIPENTDEDPSKDNSYFVEYSTHNKTITFQTSQRNGEVCKYTFQLNPGDGRATLVDEVGNIIQIQTPESTIFISNSTGSLMEINKSKIHIQSGESISLKTGAFELKSPMIKVECDAFELKSSQTRIHGTLEVDGILAKTMQVMAPIFAPGILGPPFVPGPPVPPFATVVPPLKYPFK